MIVCERLGNYKAQAKHKKFSNKRYYLKKKFGISQEDYETMLEEQGGVCKICGTPDPGSRSEVKHFAIDHSHETGKVRGLLCMPCNTGLGCFKDSIDSLNKAIKYLGD